MKNGMIFSLVIFVVHFLCCYNNSYCVLLDRCTMVSLPMVTWLIIVVGFFLYVVLLHVLECVPAIDCACACVCVCVYKCMVQWIQWTVCKAATPTITKMKNKMNNNNKNQMKCDSIVPIHCTISRDESIVTFYVWKLEKRAQKTREKKTIAWNRSGKRRSKH